MDHQYRENGARYMSSNYDQMRAYVECSPNQSKNCTLPTFQSSNIGETLKIPEKCWPIMYQSIAVQLYQLTLLRWLSLLYVYK